MSVDGGASYMGSCWLLVVIAAEFTHMFVSGDHVAGGGFEEGCARGFAVVVVGGGIEFFLKKCAIGESQDLVVGIETTTVFVEVFFSRGDGGRDGFRYGGVNCWGLGFRSWR